MTAGAERVDTKAKGRIGATCLLHTELFVLIVCICMYLGDQKTARDFKEILYLRMGPRQLYLTEMFAGSVFG